MGFQLKRNNENTFSFFLLMVVSNNPTHARVTGSTDIKDLCITSSSPKYAENITRQFFLILSYMWFCASFIMLSRKFERVNNINLHR